MAFYKSATNKLGDTNENIVFDMIKNTKELITDTEMQKHYGDIKIITTNGEARYIEVKSGHSYKGMDKVAIDICYLDNNYNPYIPINATDNKGWLYSLDKCNTLAIVNKSKTKVYLIAWQVLRDKLIKLLNGKLEDIKRVLKNGFSYYLNEKGLEIMVNNKDPHKKTVCITVRLTKTVVNLYGAGFKEVDINI